MSKHFHSGARLMLARRLKGWSQEGLLEISDFPSIDIRTLWRWEKNGIPSKYHEKVAYLFQLDAWVFADSRLTKRMFEQLIEAPSKQQAVHQELDDLGEAVPIDESSAQQWESTDDPNPRKWNQGIVTGDLPSVTITKNPTKVLKSEEEEQQRLIDNLESQCYFLKLQIESYKKEIALKNELIEAKDSVIAAQKDTIKIAKHDLVQMQKTVAYVKKMKTASSRSHSRREALDS